MIIDFVDCNIPAVFGVGSMVAVGKLDDTWRCQFKSVSDGNLSFLPCPLFLMLFSISQ
jgi:hypothetical protein